jgi:20S proteasome alpha/beta subunit
MVSFLQYFRVQALLLGGDDIDPKRGMCIYSVDPSGSWQSWGAGACIGKYAKQIRKQIAKKLETPASSLKEALEYLIECWVDTCKAENVNLKKQEDYQALILHRDPENQHCKLFQVTDESVNDMVATLIAIKTP